MVIPHSKSIQTRLTMLCPTIIPCTEMRFKENAASLSSCTLGLLSRRLHQGASDALDSVWKHVSRNSANVDVNFTLQASLCSFITNFNAKPANFSLRRWSSSEQQRLSPISSKSGKTSSAGQSYKNGTQSRPKSPNHLHHSARSTISHLGASTRTMTDATQERNCTKL